MEETKNRVVKDCIYGHIEIPDLCAKFMDVPEFQRLRRIKQLGMVHYTYPSAVHTRFEHSLGVMHLAGKMVDQLRQYRSISDRTKQLVQLGGMYHDIGHAAYSHLFDSMLMLMGSDELVPSVFQFRLQAHEERSVHYLVRVNLRLRLLSLEEEKFVIDVIRGHVANEELHYLYQIVCNKECGIDVDKMDYLRRDAYHTGFPAFQSDYILLNARIDHENHIAFRAKTRHDILDLFATRQKMHVNVYQHHTSREMDKLHFCMMKRLGPGLFMYGEMTDDANIETLIRNTPELCELVDCVDTRKLHHECEICQEFSVLPHITQAGSIELVRFIQ